MVLNPCKEKKKFLLYVYASVSINSKAYFSFIYDSSVQIDMAIK